jgi:FtsZ-binding cell division protein ZapB
VREEVQDSFKLLEDKVQKAAERLKGLHAETESLREELAKARARAHEAEQRLEAVAGGDGARGGSTKKGEGQAREVKTLRRERDEIRSRIRRLVELLEKVE